MITLKKGNWRIPKWTFCAARATKAWNVTSEAKDRVDPQIEQGWLTPPTPQPVGSSDCTITNGAGHLPQEPESCDGP